MKLLRDMFLIQLQLLPQNKYFHVLKIFSLAALANVSNEKCKLDLRTVLQRLQAAAEKSDNAMLVDSKL